MSDLLEIICTTVGLNVASSIIYDISKNIGISILPHQKCNLIKWLEQWNPSESDIELIKSDEQLNRKISIIFGNVQNELFEKKLSLWGIITDNVIRGKETETDEEMYLIQIFTQIPIPTLEFLLKIKSREYLTTNDIYPDGFPYPENSISEKNSRAYIFASTHGLITLNGENTILTGFGKRFLDFIGDKYQSKVYSKNTTNKTTPDK